MQTRPGLYNCFEHSETLHDSERQQLAELASDRLTCSRDDVIVREGEPSNGLFVVEQGVCYTQRNLDDGSRQIIDIHFPGEIIGLDQLSQPHHLSGLTALTDTALFVYNKLSVMNLFTGSPALARLLLNMVSNGQAILTERIVGLSRYGALRRVAHFLLEMLYRAGNASALGLQTLSKVPTDSRTHSLAPPQTFRIPQNVIADTLGLSFVHVSRILRQLREKNLVSTRGQGITLLDIEGLRAVAGFDPAARWLRPGTA